ncbi:ABC transporter permease [Paenibacillus bovis]|uniref:ABC transporter permease n=1 Tax=Paenibacillus bovis TaxID=1616788 RepID=A0A172ZDN5_9BACL|nr:ABC transporter permease [Paenibacillus bovis]ANF95472.1 ABC transporter permease [Paenibacillus bovis]
MNKLGAVIGFTYRNKTKTKSFRWTTFILLLLLVVGLNIPYFIQLFSGQSDKDLVRIGIASGSYQQIAGQIKEAADKTAATKPVAANNTDNAGAAEVNALRGTGVTRIEWQAEPADPAKLRKQIEAGKLDGYLQLQKPAAGEIFPSITYISEKNNASVQAMLQAAAQTAKVRSVTSGQLTEAQLNEIGTPVNLTRIALDNMKGADGKSGALTMENYILVYLLLILFFISLTMTGNMIASEITAEKSSRVMEILITSVSPLTQMFGKIIGIFLVGLTQMGLYALVFIVHLMLPYYQQVLAQFDIHISNLSWEVAVLGLVYYVLGYFLYSTLYAAVGSIVSRTEDLGQAVSLLTVLTLAAFYIGIFSMTNPDSMLMKISSYIPFFSPTTAIVRIGLGNMPWWELTISLLILVIAIFIFGWLSAKIYRTGVLMYGKRPSWKEIRKAMKAYKI